MQVNLIQPKNKLLQKYISYFYFFERNEKDKEITYYGFPNNNTFLTILKNTTYTINQPNIEIVGSEDFAIDTFLFFDDKTPGFLNYKKAVSEITICFKPLGINSFLQNDFVFYLHEAISKFNEFDAFNNDLDSIFLSNEIDKKLLLLESFLLSKIKPFKHTFLFQITEKLSVDFEKDSISNLANEFNISRPTLNKHFKRYIGTNPNQFAKIARFRNAIKIFTSKTSENLLVDVAFLSDYFDQSHMSKDFKSMTGYTPKVFFSKLTQLENGQINWLFL